MKQEQSDSPPINQDLVKLFSLFRRKIGILILFTVLGLLLSGIYSLVLIPTQFSADVLLYIWQDRDVTQTDTLTASDLNLLSQLVNDYQALIKSRLVTRQVADELKMSPEEYERLADKITVGVKENTRHITISVVDEKASSAAAIANTLAKYFSLAVVDKMGAADVRIIDPAVTTEKPVSRGTLSLLAIGGLAGLLLGVGFILLKVSLDTKVRSAMDVQTLTDLDTLGLILAYEQTSLTGEGAYYASRDSMGASRYNDDLIAQKDQLSAISEAFKEARTHIEYSAVDPGIRSLMVTSTQRSEGKTVTLANLAITFARKGRSVLLVDADLHQPTLHDYFGLQNRSGLTSILTGTGHFSQYVRPTLTDNLSILTAGPIPSNPSDLLISQSMADLIQELSGLYELVLIDCPPIGVMTDVSIVATRVDASLLIVRSGVTNRYQLQRAINLLRQVQACVLGFILTGVDKHSDDYDYVDGRYERNLQRQKPDSGQGQIVMKAVPLLKEPVIQKESSNAFLFADDLKTKQSNGKQAGTNKDWRG